MPCSERRREEREGPAENKGEANWVERACFSTTDSECINSLAVVRTRRSIKDTKTPQKGGGKSKANARQPRRKINTPPRVLKGSPKLCSLFRTKKKPGQEKRGEMAHGRVSRYGNKARGDGRGGEGKRKEAKARPPSSPFPTWILSLHHEGGL